MAISRAELLADFKAWAERNAPELLAPRTKAQCVLDTVIAYAELAAGWDPTKEDDYGDFVEVITHIVND